MLEFAPEMSASVPFIRIHWYVYVGLVSPSASMMPVVTAVSVLPTCAVPVMVGAPVAAVLGVPGAVSLTVMSVPAVRETPELLQYLERVLMLVASARTKEVLPTTRVRAAVAVVMSASTLNSSCPLERTKSPAML